MRCCLEAYLHGLQLRVSKKSSLGDALDFVVVEAAARTKSEHKTRFSFHFKIHALRRMGGGCVCETRGESCVLMLHLPRTAEKHFLGINEM